MQPYDDEPVSHPAPDPAAASSEPRPEVSSRPQPADGSPGGAPVGPNLFSRLVVLVLIFAAVLAAGTVAYVWGDDAERKTTRRASGATPSPSSSPRPSASISTDAVDARHAGIGRLLELRGAAVRDRDRAAFLALVDPGADRFRAQQGRLFDRLMQVPLAAWSYELEGAGPSLSAGRASRLPRGSAVVRVRLRYRFTVSDSAVEREQYLTVVPHPGHWLFAGDGDARASGRQTERDIWDLGPLLVVRGRTSLVLGDASRAELRRLAVQADRAVRDVDGVWQREWSRHPVVVFPRSQRDMAALIGSDGKGLAQIAAVTTGSFAAGLSRGDRVVVNSEAWRTLGSLGRRVVLAHEMTHLATRVITVAPVPIWVSEGFADYVAYRAVRVATSLVADDIFDVVRAGDTPRRLPEHAEFDAAKGEIAAAYEGAWLACRMIAERYGQKRLIALYSSLADGTPPPPGGDVRAILGIGEQRLTRQWRSYLVSQAAR